MNYFTDFLKSMMELLHSVTNDYGIAIVIFTVLIRLLLVPLDTKQRRQMQKQKEISEAIQVLREKYGNDKRKMDTEINKYYQENGIGLGGYVLAVLPFPIMIGLYHAIRLISASACTTVLLPWVSSLIVRDQFLILPIATIIVQILPQIYPYLRVFDSLGLCRQPAKTILAMAFLNGMYLFMIPSGVGLYCFVSGMFQAMEQLILNMISVRKMKTQEAF